jgi:hypothetical protein
MVSRRSEKSLCRSIGRTNLFSEGRHVLYAFVLASDFNFNYAIYEIKITILFMCLKFNAVLGTEWKQLLNMSTLGYARNIVSRQFCDFVS